MNAQQIKEKFELQRRTFEFTDETPNYVKRLATLLTRDVPVSVMKDIALVVDEWLEMRKTLDDIAENAKDI